MDGRSFAQMERILNYAKKHGRDAACKNYEISVNVFKNIQRRFKKKVDGRYKLIPTEKIEMYQAIAKQYAMKSKMPELADDYSQYAMLCMVRGKQFNNDWLWPEFLKVTYGDLRNESGKAKSEAYFTSKVLTTTSHDFENKEFDIGREDAELGNLDVLDFLNETKLNGIDRAIVVLYLVYGFNYKEISVTFGMSETWSKSKIFNLLNQIRELLKK